MSSKIIIPERSEDEVTVARICAELVRQGVTFEVERVIGPINGRQWEIVFTGGY
jgi:hypothetical protein